MIRTTASLAAVLSLAAGLAWADSHETTEAGAATEGMDHGDVAMGEPNAAMMSYMAVMETSMGLMPSDSTGDADADFLLMMIPHHQSAVDMARIVLEVGDDPEVQALAQEIIDSQEAEITRMQEMLAAMNVEAPAAAGAEVAPAEAEEPAASE